MQNVEQKRTTRQMKDTLLQYEKDLKRNEMMNRKVSKNNVLEQQNNKS